MAGTFFSFDAPNAGGFSIAGSKFLIDGMDLSDAAPPFFRAVEKIARRQFQKGGSIADPEQEQWRPLSKRYAVWKVRYYKGPRGRFFPQVMTLSGKLQSALTRPNAPGAIRIGEAERFTYGALVRSDSGYDYGHAHQMGHVRGIARKTITPPVSGSSVPKEWRAAIRPVQRHIVEAATRHLGEFMPEITEQDRHLRSIRFER